MSPRLHIVTASPSAVRTPVDGSPPPPAGAVLADAAVSVRDDPRPVERRCVSTFRDGVDLDRKVVALERLAVGWWLPCRWLDVWKAHR